MIIDWTLLAPLVATIGGVRIFLRSRRQYDAGEIERRSYLAGVGGFIGAVWGSLYLGVGHPWVAGMFVVLLLPEALVPERHHDRFEAWLMRHLLAKKERRRVEEFQARQAAERAAELEFEERMKHPEIAPGPPRENDP